MEIFIGQRQPAEADNTAGSHQQRHQSHRGNQAGANAKAPQGAGKRDAGLGSIEFGVQRLGLAHLFAARFRAH